MNTHTPGTVSQKSFCKAVLQGGLAAGTCDLVLAICYYGILGAKIPRILQAIAGGLLGKEAYKGGFATAALGVGLHYLIAFIWAATYVVASRHIPLLLRHAKPCGLIFGILVYSFMNLVVLPLSALQTKIGPQLLNAWLLAIHMLGVGLPIALSARHWLYSKTDAK